MVVTPTLFASYPSNRNHLGCRNEVTPEPPEPKNINVGKHACANVDEASLFAPTLDTVKI